MDQLPSIEQRTRRWWRGRPRLPVLLLFGLVAIGLVGGVFLIANTIRAEQTERQQATRTEQLVGLLADINRAAVNAETGQRGYFITLDRRYLAPYETGRAQLGPLVARLHEQVQAYGSPEQKEMAQRIEDLATRRLAELDSSVAQITQGDRKGAERQILTDEGQHLMLQLRATLERMAAFEKARLRAIRASSVETERRIIPLLAVLLVLIVAALGLGLWQVFRAARLEASEAQAVTLRQARDRADLLARELNHRVKNLFAVVLAIVRMSARENPEARGAIDQVAGRIEALTKAHDVTQGAARQRVARLNQLVDTAVAPYCSDDFGCKIAGPDIDLPEASVVPVGLILHEWATNAVKYGGWAQPGGLVEVSWERAADRLDLHWRETCANGAPAPVSGKQGFGSTLIESAARQLGGTFERTFHPEGIAHHLSFPLAH